MAGRLVDRVKSLIAAALRDLSDAPHVDSGPGATSAQLRNIETALSDVRDQLGAALARRHQLSKQARAQGDTADSVATKAAIAIAADREDLARAALEHQLHAELLAESASAQLAALDLEISQLEALAVQLSAARRAFTGAPTPQGRTAALAELDELVARVMREESR